MVEIDRIRNTNAENKKESRRFTLLPLREVDLDNQKDLKDYFALLTHPLNIEHFSSPPIDSENLKQKLVRDSTHAYLAENGLGDVIGAGGINDAEEAQHDHFLVKVAVNPELQGRRMGRQLVIRLIDEAFSTKTNDGRDRTKLDAAIIEDVEGWQRMPHILEGLGFQFRSRLPKQVDVFVQKEGRFVTKSTQRWEIMREDWMRIKRRSDVREIFRQQLP